MPSAWGLSWGSAWGDAWGDIASAPTLLGQIPNLSAAYDSGTHQFDLSEYFANADTYAIDPALETGWSFDTNTGILEIDTDDEDTFGPFTVTASNANGDTESNGFSVTVSAWTQSGTIAGTAVSAEGVMGTNFLDDSTSVPAAYFHNGYCHDANGKRYVALWPADDAVAYFGQIARRADGAMLINPSGTITNFSGGWGLTYRGEVVAVVDTPDIVLGGFGLLSTGELCVSEVS